MNRHPGAVTAPTAVIDDPNRDGEHNDKKQNVGDVKLHWFILSYCKYITGGKPHDAQYGIDPPGPAQDLHGQSQRV
jgi:hypothetical protein